MKEEKNLIGTCAVGYMEYLETNDSLAFTCTDVALDFKNSSNS